MAVTSIYKSAAGKQAVERRYREALARWPVAHRQLVVPTRHGHTFIVASGDAGAPPASPEATMKVWPWRVGTTSCRWATGHRASASRYRRSTACFPAADL